LVVSSEIFSCFIWCFVSTTCDSGWGISTKTECEKVRKECRADTLVRMGDASSATDRHEGNLAGGTGDADKSVRAPSALLFV